MTKENLMTKWETSWDQYDGWVETFINDIKACIIGDGAKYISNTMSYRTFGA